MDVPNPGNNEALRQYVRGGKHLPAPLRDFHDAKDVFRAVESVLGRQEDPYGVDWVRAQCYVIDKFLRFMALHGYTLQRSRAGFEFADLVETLRDMDRREGATFRAIFAAPPSDQASVSPAPGASDVE